MFLLSISYLLGLERPHCQTKSIDCPGFLSEIGDTECGSLRFFPDGEQVYLGRVRLVADLVENGLHRDWSLHRRAHRERD